MREIGELKEPFFAVVHYMNVHRPRIYDPANAPFQPSHTSDAGTGGERGRNHYYNAVYASDVAVAKLVKRVRESEAGKRTVIVYTSDHGESFREHDNENDHSGSVYDEEIRVPAFIDAPPGTLSPDEEGSLRRARHELTWQYDLTATMLDLMGLWDAPGMAPFKDRLVGLPLTRPERTTKPVSLTNTAWVWEYIEPNWGLMIGKRKLLATSRDESYRCFDVLADPREKNDLGEDGCPELLEVAKHRFGPRLPKDLRWLAWHREWPPH
jgi:arylsulfatase A-like enzyme